jgi:hypothetical protein
MDINITIPDLDVVTTFRIGANPGFIRDGSPLAAEVRQGYQVAHMTFVALGHSILFHGIHLPALILREVYTTPMIIGNRLAFEI